MIKISGVFLLILLLAGCARSLETYVEHPETILRDPHFEGYQENLDALESQYLNKKITYAQYLEQKKQLENTYNKEVRQREEIINSPGY